MTYSDKFGLLPTIGKNIRSLRKKNEFTAQELAMLVGVSDRTIASIESGLRGTTIENYAKMADVFGVSIDELIGRTTRREALGLGEPAGSKQNKLRNICKSLTDEQAELVISFVNNLKTYTKEIEMNISKENNNNNNTE